METKKNPKFDLSRKYGLILNIGFCLSLSLVIAAFEWPSYKDSGIVDLGKVEIEITEIIDTPLTDQPPPKPPVIQLPEIEAVPDEKEIEEELPPDFDVEMTEGAIIEDIVPKIKEEEPDVVWDFVEEKPQFPGGIEAFFKFVGDNLNYPLQARRMGIEGKVYLQFIVDKDGSITEVNALKGIGAGCDEEAVRVLNQAPKFIPGKQRGRPVKVKMILPVYFKLSN
ncbi:MAG: TonB family protein [Bacteroidota bacterium]